MRRGLEPGSIVRRCASSPAEASTTARARWSVACSTIQDAARRPARCAGVESRTAGTTGGDLDFALVVDGLQAEREQGITIDVAYRFFAPEAAPLHRRRHAGARAVYPQHGDRRLQRRSRRGSGRRPQGHHHADAPSQPHPVAAGHPSRRARREQDGSDRISTADRFAAITAEYLDAGPDSSGSPRSSASVGGARRRQHRRRRAARMPWYTGPTVTGLSGIGAMNISGDDLAAAVPACRCSNGSTGRMRIFAASAGGSPAERSGPATP